MLKFKNNIIYLLLAIFTLVSCGKDDTIKVALSKGTGSVHYDNYSKWLNKFDSTIEFIDLYHIPRSEAMEILSECSGIVLTGGPDVEPSRYGRNDTDKCEIDYKRDTLEFALIKEAINLNLPILAICRGEQILNVAFQGSLIVDIPSEYDTLVTHRCPESDTCFHEIMVLKNSQLYDLSKITKGIVNTNHHQAVDKLADVFIATAYTKDGIIEAYEWKDTTNKPFMIAVQWHPERLDSNNVLSNPLGNKFIEEVKKKKIEQEIE